MVHGKIAVITGMFINFLIYAIFYQPIDHRSSLTWSRKNYFVSSLGKTLKSKTNTSPQFLFFVEGVEANVYA